MARERLTFDNDDGRFSSRSTAVVSDERDVLYLKKLAKCYGLHVITAVDKAVLDAAASIHPRSLVRPLQYVDNWGEFVDAELARRESKDAK